MRTLIKKSKASILLPAVIAGFGLAVVLPAHADWSVNDPVAVTNDCGALGTNCSGYANTQASFNDSHDKYPVMNNVGDIVWQGRPSGGSSYDYEIYFRSAYSGLIEPVTEDSNYDSYPRINDTAEISWQSYDGSSFYVNLYSGGSSSIISQPTALEPWPKINNMGEVAWIHVDGHDYEIHLYSGSSVEQVTDNETNDVQVRINDDGDLMWRGRGDLQADLSYDIYTRIGGGEITQVTQDDLFDWSPQITNTKHMVWLSYDGVQCDVVVQRNGETVPTQITTTPGEDHNPVINNEGVVAWQGHDGNDWEIFVYSGDTITQLTDNDYDDVTPQINSAGDIAWFAFGGDIGVYLFEPDSGTVSKLSESYTGHYDSVPDINDQGKVVWSGFDGTDFEIIVAEPPGGLHDDLFLYPQTLNLQSKGKYLKALIDLRPTDLATEIDPETVVITMISKVNSTKPIFVDPPLKCNGEYLYGDSNNDGIKDITVWFDRQEIIRLIEPEGPGTYNLTIYGELWDGRDFPGEQMIKVIDRKMKGYKKAHPRFEKLNNGKGVGQSRCPALDKNNKLKDEYAELGKKVVKALKKEQK